MLAKVIEQNRIMLAKQKCHVSLYISGLQQVWSFECHTTYMSDGKLYYHVTSNEGWIKCSPVSVQADFRHLNM